MSHVESASLAKSKTHEIFSEISLDATRYSYSLRVKKEHKIKIKRGNPIATDKEANIEVSCGVR